MANATSGTVLDFDLAEVSAAHAPGDVCDTGSSAVTIPYEIGHDCDGVVFVIRSTSTVALKAEILKGTNANSLLASKGSVQVAAIGAGNSTPQVYILRCDDPARHLITDTVKGYINLRLTPNSGTIACTIWCIKLNKPR